ncbi:unnamed protein product [Ostreobium quekettii]|uniref:Uncharacterized protein n=1 Tax=Ostreobium quekettii TaxID=121088 RepID=A0A8S1J6H0_9CHLO|nr:unnamed protein product [Ostreobium quekettii]|eukprot:evm.model.scf_23.16 EVM.evm.TU.scf_23.16   scf_23:188710-191884(-)
MVAGPVAGWPVGSGHGWPPIGASAACRSKEEFERLDELWDSVWSGEVCVGPANPPASKPGGLSEWTSNPAFAAHSRSAIGGRHPLNASDSQKGSMVKSASCPSLYAGPNGRGLLQRLKSWLEQMQDRRRGIVYTNTGPCQLFSDWGIPPYPEDYEWD